MVAGSNGGRGVLVEEQRLLFPVHLHQLLAVTVEALQVELLGRGRRRLGVER